MAAAGSGAVLVRVAVVGVAGLPDLELELGPITALVGPRGSGKSQLLASIAWLVSGRPPIVPAVERTAATVSAELCADGQSVSVVRKPGVPLAFGSSRRANPALPACTFLRARDRFGRPPAAITGSVGARLAGLAHQPRSDAAAAEALVLAVEACCEECLSGELLLIEEPELLSPASPRPLRCRSACPRIVTSMHTTAAPSHGDQAAGPVTLGSGWLWPAALVAMFVALFYVPGHNPSSGGGEDLVATIAALYVVGLIVVGVRLVRGVILRAGGSHEPVVLLGSGPNPLASGAIRPRWRLAAVAAGAIVPVAAAIAAARLAVAADPVTNAHAIASLALGVNAVIAAGVLVPAPGFPGWALLLGVVDAAGARPHQRVRRAALVAQSVGVPILLAAGAAAALLGDPMLMFLGFVLGFVTWSGSQAAAAQDATVRFLAAHGAGEVARPIVSHAAPDEPIDDLVARLRRDNAVVAVEAGGGILGAIGPRQLAAGGVVKRDERCSEVMVPLGSLRLIGPASPAVEALPEIARHGFALVTGPEGLGYVEAGDLGRQIRIWVALGDRPAVEPAPRAVERT